MRGKVEKIAAGVLCLIVAVSAVILWGFEGHQKDVLLLITAASMAASSVLLVLVCCLMINRKIQADRENPTGG